MKTIILLFLVFDNVEELSLEERTEMAKPAQRKNIKKHST
jgi:hypothetical protein